MCVCYLVVTKTGFNDKMSFLNINVSIFHCKTFLIIRISWLLQQFEFDSKVAGLFNYLRQE